jgi:Protein of unknown function (DUF3551)
MRLILASAAAVIGLLALDIQPGAAQNTTRPFCMRGGIFGQGSWDCSYHSMQQCLDSASGLNGTCMANPWYEGPRRGAPKRRQQY